MPRDLFPGDLYPPYPAGGAYIINPVMMKILLETLSASELKNIPFEGEY